MERIIKFLIMQFKLFLIILTFSLISSSCRIFKIKSHKSVSETFLFKKNHKKCTNPKLGDELILQVSYYNLEKNKIKDTLIIKLLGNKNNGEKWNNILDHINPCDSAFVTGSLFNKNPEIAYTGIKMLGFSTLKNTETNFFELIKNNQSINPDSLFSDIEYGDTVTFKKFELDQRGHWKIYPNETFIYSVSMQEYWIKKWNLLGYPNTWLIDTNSNSKFLYQIHQIRPQKSIPVSNFMQVDEINWIQLSEGLSYKKVFDTYSPIPPKNTWIQIEYQIFNSKLKPILTKPEITSFYFNDELVPKAWVKCLFNAHKNDHFYIQADYNWAYGKKGLFPLIDPKEKVYFDIKVIDVPQE